MVLTTDDLVLYKRCSRRVFLERFGDSSCRESTSGFVRKLQRDSTDHRRQIIANWSAAGSTQRVEFPNGDWNSGAAETLRLMEAGAPLISRGVLIKPAGEDGLDWIGRPHLLVRSPEPSTFGDWSYRPVDIRMGKRPKLEYQLVATFHTILLEMIQEAPVRYAEILLRGRSPHRVDLFTRRPQLLELCGDAETVLTSDTLPEYFISRSRCSLCPWLSQCHSQAQQDQHISLIPGVTPTRYRVLAALGITDLGAIAKADPKDLAKYPELANGGVQNLINQARSCQEKRPVPRRDDTWEQLRQLPKSSVELYYDIEAEPERSVDYLHGVLVVKRDLQRRVISEKFHAFWAETPEEEGTAWNRFVEFMEQYPDAPIFHFCEYEPNTLGKLGKRHGTAAKQVDRLRNRCVDLHAWVTRLFFLPVEGYALKQIAAYLGFSWRDSTANGSQAVFWYDQWLETGDRQLLETIEIYNEDDCWGTYHIAKWFEGLAREDELAIAETA
ncbi:MAG: TM0106 family RecB-like putative nuclease [Cyanobacteria bacterium P01_C01_bin.89]